MTTGVTQIPGARQDPRQVVNTIKRTVNWNDNASGVAAALDQGLPQGAFISRVLVEVVTAFNGTTPTVTLGSNSTTFNDIVAAADVNWGLAGVYECTRGYGRAIAAAADKQLKTIYTNGGGGPSAGQAVILIEYEGGFST